jgi:hypothetical protein
MIEKNVSVDRIEVLENGCVQVRQKISIVENGLEISATFHRHVVAPGDNYSQESDRVKAICQLVHTPEAVQAYKDKLQSERN